MDIKKGKNFQFFDEITIKASPPIYILRYWKPQKSTQKIQQQQKIRLKKKYLTKKVTLKSNSKSDLIEEKKSIKKSKIQKGFYSKSTKKTLKKIRWLKKSTLKSKLIQYVINKDCNKDLAEKSM